jgi:peptidyl-prolyl cis-trans isomerase D
MVSKVNQTAFANELNWISHPINIEKSLVVFQISEIQKERIQPLAEARQTILTQLQTQKKIDRVEQPCREAWKRIQEGQDFETAASGLDAQTFDTGSFTMSANVNRVGEDPAFKGGAFKLKPGETSNPVRGIKGYYLIRMVDRTPILESDFQAQKDQQYQQTLKGKQEQAYMAWYNGIKKNAKIKDYRNLYF